jgi:hypothetical protein
MNNITKLKNYFKDNLKENYNIGRLTWFKTTAFAKYFILLNCYNSSFNGKLFSKVMII